MKKAFFVLVCSVGLVLGGCTTPSENMSSENEKKMPVGYEQYLGKPTVMIRGSMSCPHCRNAMPVFEKDIYEVYSGDINVLLNNVGDISFQTSIPQTGRAFDFKQFTQEECGYIPTRVLLDADGKSVLASCGAQKTLEDMQKSLKGLLE